MNKVQAQKFIGQHVIVQLENKTLNGNLISVNDTNARLQLDCGIIQIQLDKIKDFTKSLTMPNLNVYVCKNDVLGCKGCRMITTEKKAVWCCKHHKKFDCTIKRICDFNQLPLNIKMAFLDGMHSTIPVVDQKK